ncbi:MAG: hypothetical protein MUF73_00780, partial [Rhodobacteraceae bacterium]|nr:hypothetical protein [Paracoccaceae bacterium]
RDGGRTSGRGPGGRACRGVAAALAGRPVGPHHPSSARVPVRSPGWIARHHLAPHLPPQTIAGFVLIFPQAILHEAGLSFIGPGIPPHLPSIGVVLADPMRAVVAGYGWLAVFPGRAADPAEGGA